MSDGWQAFIAEDGESWLGGHVRLYLSERRADRIGYVTDTVLTLRTVGEDEIVPKSGILLPKAVIPALLEGIERWQGRTNHAATEAAVLREWLAVERARVDRALGP